MRTVGPRTNLKKTYPRCHYNSKGKSKKQFSTKKEAEDYLVSHKLEGYTIYQCRVCNMYHISHKNKRKETDDEKERKGIPEEDNKGITGRVPGKEGSDNGG